jgi:GNAT superfamily N-acetyltransferase
VTDAPRLAGARDLDDVVRVFAEALAADPMITWPLPRGATVEDAAAVFEILIHDAYGALDVLWVAGDGRVDAAAAWLPPEEVRRFGEIETATRPRIEALTDDGGARYAVFWDWLGDHLPTEPCWFLDILAVREAARGGGLASTLVRHGLERAHGAGQPAFLETSNPANLPMYEHLGFHVDERADAPDGGPTIWFLRADPA